MRIVGRESHRGATAFKAHQIVIITAARDIKEIVTTTVPRVRVIREVVMAADHRAIKETVIATVLKETARTTVFKVRETAMEYGREDIQGIEMATVLRVRVIREVVMAADHRAIKGTVTEIALKAKEIVTITVSNLKEVVMVLAKEDFRQVVTEHGREDFKEIAIVAAKEDFRETVTAIAKEDFKEVVTVDGEAIQVKRTFPNLLILRLQLNLKATEAIKMPIRMINMIRRI